MNRRSFLMTFTSGALFSAAGLALPAAAQRGRDRDDRDRDRDYGRGRFDRRPYDRPRVQGFVRQLQRETDVLRVRADQVIRRDRIDGSRARRLRDRIRELENAADRLGTGIGRSRVFNRNVSRREMNEVLRAGNRVQEIVRERDWQDELGRPWANVRRHLNELARAYDLPTLGERD